MSVQVAREHADTRHATGLGTGRGARATRAGAVRNRLTATRVSLSSLYLSPAHGKAPYRHARLLAAMGMTRECGTEDRATRGSLTQSVTRTSPSMPPSSMLQRRTTAELYVSHHTHISTELRRGLSERWSSWHFRAGPHRPRMRSSRSHRDRTV